MFEKGEDSQVFHPLQDLNPDAAFLMHGESRFDFKQGAVCMKTEEILDILLVICIYNM